MEEEGEWLEAEVSSEMVKTVAEVGVRNGAEVGVTVAGEVKGRCWWCREVLICNGFGCATGTAAVVVVAVVVIVVVVCMGVRGDIFELVGPMGSIELVSMGSESDSLNIVLGRFIMMASLSFFVVML